MGELNALDEGTGKARVERGRCQFAGADATVASKGRTHLYASTTIECSRQKVVMSRS